MPQLRPDTAKYSKKKKKKIHAPLFIVALDTTAEHGGNLMSISRADEDGQVRTECYPAMKRTRDAAEKH